MSSGRPGPVARVLLWMLDFYQKGISPLTPPSCRFEPSCSAYAVESVRVHGAWRGSWLASWRLLRCGPWTAGGWDPVPQPRAPAATDEAGPDPGATSDTEQSDTSATVERD